MIHVCFGLHDADGKYSKFVGASMASIFENTSAPVTVHILHDATLTNDNRDKFSYLAGRYGQRVNFHNVEELCPDEINFLRNTLADKINLRFSIGAFYRLLIKEILQRRGVNRAIYLDADIIVNLDIAELWRQNLRKFPLAAVSEIDATFDEMMKEKYLLDSGLVKTENYFCSGVILFNLNALDEKFFYDGVQFLVDNPACESPDQDILNAFFSENYLKLEQKFDSFVLAELRKNFPAANKIYHYAGRGIGLDYKNPYDNLWLENFALTPWFNADTLKNLAEKFRKISDKYVKLIQWMMIYANGKRRAVVAFPENFEVLKTIFEFNDNDTFVELNTDLTELVEKMQAERGQTIFYIFWEYYSDMKDKLISLGFKEYLHFVSGEEFLTRVQLSRPRPEYDLILEL